MWASKKSFVTATVCFAAGLFTGLTIWVVNGPGMSHPLILGTISGFNHDSMSEKHTAKLPRHDSESAQTEKIIKVLQQKLKAIQSHQPVNELQNPYKVVYAHPVKPQLKQPINQLQKPDNEVHAQPVKPNLNQAINQLRKPDQEVHAQPVKPLLNQPVNQLQKPDREVHAQPVKPQLNQSQKHGKELYADPAKPQLIKHDRQEDRDAEGDETEELIKVLQQKLQDLKAANMLVEMDKEKICTDADKISTCIDPNCSRPMPPNTSPENIRSLRKPVKTVGMDKLREVIQIFNVKPQGKKYVIVTGASSNHFVESQASIQSLHKTVFPHLSNYSFYYYDLGLTERERQLVRDFSGAELLDFPFDKLPKHIRNLNCFAWKTLIVLAHLQFSEFLMWMDTSMFFTRDIHPYFQTTSKTGFLINKDQYCLPQHTHLKLFKYFGDEPCQFSPFNEVEGGFQVLHNEPFTRRLLIEPWSACGLDPNCMCPAESLNMLICPMSVRKYGKCHRFDQATIGYITAKVLREHRPSVLIKDYCHEVKRGQKSSYLQDLQKAKTAKSEFTTKPKIV